MKRIRDILTLPVRRPWATAAVVLVFLHLVKASLFIGVGQPPLEGDALSYWASGLRVAEGDWMIARGVPEVIRTPGYPVFLGLNRMVFGRYGLVAATCIQQLLVVVVALIAAGMCRRVNGSRLGGLLGLAIGLFCVSQNCIADRLFSETLFNVLLTAAMALLLAWIDRPTLLRAALTGLLLGAATLVRPVSQLAWVPLLAVMAWRAGELKMFRRSAVHAVVLLAVMAATLAPWYVRNYVCCGKAFLVKASGLTMWASCFHGSPDDRLNPAMPFADAPATRKLFETLHDGDSKSHWGVYRRLLESGRSRVEANDCMEAVCWEAVRARPLLFLDSRVRRFLWFWITPNGTFRPRTPQFHMTPPPSEDSSDSAQLPEDYGDQVHWFSESYFHDGSLNWLWHPSVGIYLLAGLVAFTGALVLAIDPARRSQGMALSVMLLYVAAVTAVGAPPEYRYRMVLEPLMVVCAVRVVEPLMLFLAARACPRRLCDALRSDSPLSP
jgi:hypothetical protein